MATNGASDAHREPVRKARGVIHVPAGPNAGCVRRHSILANRALRVLWRCRHGFCRRRDLGGGWRDRHWVEEVRGEVQNHGRCSLGRTGRLVEDAVGEFQQAHLIEHEAIHDCVARGGSHLVDGAHKELIAPLDDSGKDVCEPVVHIGITNDSG